MERIEQVTRMEELVKKLNKAAEAYYNSGEEIMSNKEYDDLYDELAQLEQSSGIVFGNSPTQKVGYEVVDELPKDRHEVPALSLDKTKDIEEFPKIFNVFDGFGVVMWKMDGSTLVATYDEGKLTKLVTRGNGEVGSVITHNAPYIKGLPMVIPYKGHLVVRGEAAMTYAEFERINAELPYGVEKYKNPRNLANATVQLHDSSEMAKREICFHAFKLVSMEYGMAGCMTVQFGQLKTWGFNTVEYKLVTAGKIKEVMNDFSNRMGSFAFPVDGLVVASNDTVEAEKMPGTGKFPHKTVGYAFKWKDATAETTLAKIEWSPSRTGLLNPVAVFDPPVELEGTTVTRASLHNVSYIMEKDLQIGDRVTVYKANMIIPQIAENLSTNQKRQSVKISSKYALIDKCPVCNETTGLSDNGTTMTLICNNPFCPAKQVGKFVHFCETDCMNIVGMSESTLERFIAEGFIKEYADLYHLDRYKEQIVSMEGFGEKSYEKIIEAVEKSKKNVGFVQFIHALGIPNVGKGQAKLLYSYYLFNEEDKGCNYLYNLINDAMSGMDFQFIDGIGEVINNSIINYFKSNLEYDGTDEIQRVIEELEFLKEDEKPSATLEGKVFVITGSLNHYANRDELVKIIEANGGKASGSVSAKTSFLINNDVTSTSGKNKKAKELGVPIISEEQFMDMIQ